METVRNIIFLCYALILVAIAVIDWFTYLIPDFCILGIAACGICKALLLGISAGEAAGFGITVFLCALAFFMDRGKNIGGGDLKLIAVSSLFLSVPGLLYGLFLGSVLAVLVEGILFLCKKGRAVFPAGPYLAAGILISCVVC